MPAETCYKCQLQAISSQAMSEIRPESTVRNGWKLSSQCLPDTICCQIIISFIPARIQILRNGLQACVAAVQAADTSAYNVHSPAIRGPIPRLAREILVDTLSLVYQDLGGRGSLLSGELHGALALGFDGEIGNFILR